MEPILIAQAVLDKTLGVTYHKQHCYLIEAFANAGIQIVGSQKVVAATAASLERIVAELGSVFPVAAIAAKRTLAERNVAV